MPTDSYGTKYGTVVGRETVRRSLPTRRNHIIQKVRIAGHRMLYLSIHNDKQPAEIFLRVKGPDCSSELIGLYDVIARLMSVALQYGTPLEKGLNLLHAAPFLGMIASSSVQVCQI